MLLHSNKTLYKTSLVNSKTPNKINGFRIDLFTIFINLYLRLIFFVPLFEEIFYVIVFLIS